MVIGPGAFFTWYVMVLPLSLSNPMVAHPHKAVRSPHAGIVNQWSTVFLLMDSPFQISGASPSHNGLDGFPQDGTMSRGPTAGERAVPRSIPPLVTEWGMTSPEAPMTKEARMTKSE
jgi:hypothetical protein